MLGYYKEPEQTRNAFTADGWLRTGDKGVLDAEAGCASADASRTSSRPARASTWPRAAIEDKL